MRLVAGTLILIALPSVAAGSDVAAPRAACTAGQRIPPLRLIHSRDPRFEGTSFDLQVRDPWLAFEWGRQLTQRGFTEEDGLGSPQKPGRAASCADCHVPPGGGPGLVEAPPLFGVGLIELVAEQIRREAMRILDTNGNGWVGLHESRGVELFIPTAPGQPSLYFGQHWDKDGDLRPDLDPIFQVIYVNAAGRVVPDATSFAHPDAAGYKLVVEPFGHAPEGKRTATLRLAAIGALVQEMGLEAYDPSLLGDPDQDGFAGVSNAGALQPLPSSWPPDRGHRTTAHRLSLDDPDGDGVITEISEGDLDVLEWYLLNSPRPAAGATTRAGRVGARVLKSIGCTACHVPDWIIRQPETLLSQSSARPIPADRRFFDLEVKVRASTGRLDGTVRFRNRSAIPESFHLSGLYSDLRVHDLGPDYARGETADDAGRFRRTAPLWAVGSTAPYGFDGASPTLDDEIRRHGGEAAAAVTRYAEAAERDRQALLDFLASLTLYDPLSLPCDIDGDLLVESPFEIAGQVLPQEMFWPELLFAVPCRYPDFPEMPGPPPQPVNLARAYGLGLSFLRDTDRDGFPDAVDPTWNRVGWQEN
ncbi:MAG: di-heme oxidoredictase family protein [Planctomycetota bacterium]